MRFVFKRNIHIQASCFTEDGEKVDDDDFNYEVGEVIEVDDIEEEEKRGRYFMKLSGRHEGYYWALNNVPSNSIELVERKAS